MKIPDKIFIAGKEVKIEFNNNRCKEENYNGICLYDEEKIILDDKCSMQKKEEVFLHEIIHYINAVLNKNETEIDKESYIKPFGELLYQVIKQL
jgi:hypothetical protein